MIIGIGCKQVQAGMNYIIDLSNKKNGISHFNQLSVINSNKNIISII